MTDIHSTHPCDLGPEQPFLLFSYISLKVSAVHQFFCPLTLKKKFDLKNSDFLKIQYDDWTKTTEVL